MTNQNLNTPERHSTVRTRMLTLADHAPAVVPSGTPVVVRVSGFGLDGLEWSTLRETLDWPYDSALLSAMRETAFKLVQAFPETRLGLQLDDEVNLVLIDDGETHHNIPTQRLASVAASVATAEFNERLANALRDAEALAKSETTRARRTAARKAHDRSALFEAVAFPVPVETLPAYFAWRQRDLAERLTRQIWAGAPERNWENGDAFDAIALMRDRLAHYHDVRWDDLPGHVTRGVMFLCDERGGVTVDADPPDLDENPFVVLSATCRALPTHETCHLEELDDAMKIDRQSADDSFVRFMPTRKLHILYTKYVEIVEVYSDARADPHARSKLPRAAARLRALKTELGRRGIET